MMRSTAQGNLQIVTDGLIFYYDIANPNSFSIFKDELKSLARINDYILPESGSSAIIDSAVVYSADYSGGLTCNDSGYIQCPGFVDMSNSSYTIELVISPDTLNNSTPSQENYIIKSDEFDGLYIKYSDVNQSQLKISSDSAPGKTEYSTNMQADGSIYQFLLMYNADTNYFQTYVGLDAEINELKSEWVSIHYPFKIGYNFETFKLFQFRIYNKVLSTTEIGINREQFRRRYGNALV